MQESIWFQTVSDEQRRWLGQSDALPETADVVIVGAGVIGLATAYYLVQAGLTNICLIDRGTVLGEASGANAGGLWFAQQSVELGPIGPLATVSSGLYDDLAAQFDFDFERSGILELLGDENQAAQTEDRMQRVRSAGFQVEKLTGKAARSLEPGLGLTPAAALFYPSEAQLNPVKLGAELVRYLKSKGVRIWTENEVHAIDRLVETAQGAVEARTVVIASGAWTPQVTRALGWEPPIKPMRGTLLAVGPLPKTLHHTITAPRFYYWQLAAGYVAGGGSVDDVGFERGVDPATVNLIRKEMDSLLPAVAGQPTACAWSGFRPYSDDLKPVIGPVPGREGMFVAAGHFKKGVMLAPVTGKVIAELITTGRTDLPIEALSPARFVTTRS